MAKSAFEKWYMRYEKKSGWNTKDDCRASYIAALQWALRQGEYKDKWMLSYKIKAEIKKIKGS
ncbi:MAG: hypothetical protein WC196_02880 [Bacilli bacterium]